MGRMRDVESLIGLRLQDRQGSVLRRQAMVLSAAQVTLDDG
jgi:hypothetical protein